VPGYAHDDWRCEGFVTNWTDRFAEEILIVVTEDFDIVRRGLQLLALGLR
jgi:hypothetical protein